MKPELQNDSIGSVPNGNPSANGKAEIADFATSQGAGICWDALELRLAIFEKPELIHAVGNALPVLLFFIDRVSNQVESGTRPVQYQQIADELGCSLSTAKKWVSYLDKNGILKKISCGKSGVMIELVEEALGESVELRRIRALMEDLARQVASMRQVVDNSFANTLASLDRLNP